MSLGTVEDLSRIHPRLEPPRTRGGFVCFVLLPLLPPSCPGPELSALRWTGLGRGLGPQNRDQGEHWGWVRSALMGLSTVAAAEMTSGTRTPGKAGGRDIASKFGQGDNEKPGAAGLPRPFSLLSPPTANPSWDLLVAVATPRQTWNRWSPSPARTRGTPHGLHPYKGI